jgi:hypothetical protein
MGDGSLLLLVCGSGRYPPLRGRELYSFAMKRNRKHATSKQKMNMRTGHRRLATSHRYSASIAAR